MCVPFQVCLVNTVPLGISNSFILSYRVHILIMSICLDIYTRETMSTCTLVNFINLKYISIFYKTLSFSVYCVILVWLWNHVRIRSWNQPVLSNMEKVLYSRKQWVGITPWHTSNDYWTDVFSTAPRRSSQPNIDDTLFGIGIYAWLVNRC